MKRIRFRYLSCFITLLLYCSFSDSASHWVKPKKNLSTQEKIDFWTGFSLFRSPWVKSPSSTTGRDGLGPLFNARSCDACHKNGGAGQSFDEGLGSVIRMGVWDTENKLIVPTKKYGAQFQPHAVDTKSLLSKSVSTDAENNSVVSQTVFSEGAVRIQWLEQAVPVLSTGAHEKVILRKPIFDWQYLAYGEVNPRAKYSLRIAPPLYGLGLLEDVDPAEIVALTDEADRNRDGISGKRQQSPVDIDGRQERHRMGLLGWKAEHVDLKSQIAAAFHEDIGITSTLLPHQNCTQVQKACNQAINGNSGRDNVEISNEKLALVTRFVANLAPPVEGERAFRGKGFELFQESDCSKCHVIRLRTLEHGNIFPLTDLLLHDMGQGLSDDKPVGSASGREWRTPPLWGMHRRLKQLRLLHDGRARSITEAIYWHDGEGRRAREKFDRLSDREKRQLIEFVKAL